MPTYEYRCSKCGHRLEKFQGIKDAPLTQCPHCKENTLTRGPGGGGLDCNSKDQAFIARTTGKEGRIKTLPPRMDVRVLPANAIQRSHRMKSFYYLSFFIFVTFLSSTHLRAEMSTFTMPSKPVVVIQTTQGDIEVTLFPKVAPKAVENFLRLAESGYYNQLTFHRLVKDFVIQGGDPEGTGRGGKSVWGKPFEDEFDRSVQFDKVGLLAMANAGPNSNGSQFFITLTKTPWLNNKHTIFGEVTKGYDVVEKINRVPRMKSHDDIPAEPQKILKMTVK